MPTHSAVDREAAPTSRRVPQMSSGPAQGTASCFFLKEPDSWAPRVLGACLAWGHVGVPRVRTLSAEGRG